VEEIAILDVLRRHIYLIAALCIITTLAGYGLSFVSEIVPEEYDASAILLVRPREPIKIEPNNTTKEFLGFPVSQTSMVETASKTYIEIIKSPALIEAVVRELKLDNPPEKKAKTGIFAPMLNALTPVFDDVKHYIRDTAAFLKYGRVLHEDRFTKAVKRVSKGLELKSYEDTYVFEIKYTDDDPKTAADVANTTAKLSIQFMEQMRASEAKYLGDRLQNVLEQSRQRLVTARQNLENYKAAHRVFLYKTEYDAKLRVISDLEVELAKLDVGLAASQGTLTAHSYSEKRTRLLQILDERRAELATLPGIERELQLREADVDVASTTYDTVAKELKNAEIKSDPVPEARLISPAGVPRLPSRPRRSMIALVCFISGLVFSIVLAFFLEYINWRVRGINDLEDFVGLKVIGTIPRLPESPVNLV
jgi:uncharacterized protein involved in exopolysaccharide biosynthesis